IGHDALLATVGEDGEADIVEVLEEAFEAQILQETPNGYAFGHALLRQALYSSLSAPRRMLLHAHAGRALERLAGARALEQAPELAHHSSRAGQSGEVRAKALRYSLEAGRRAAKLSSHREAFDNFDRACELLQRQGAVDLAARLEAVEGRGSAGRALGLWEPA